MSESGVVAETLESQAELPLVTPTAKRRFELPPDAEVSKPDQNTGEQATPPVSDGETPKVEEVLTPEQVEERDRKREGQRFGRKLDKAYRQRAEAQARAEFLEKQLAEVRQAQQAPRIEGEPTLEQHGFDPEKYAEAKANFAKTQATKEFEAKRNDESSKQYQARLVSSWQDKVDAVEEKYDDFDTVVGELKPTNPLIAAIMEADNGADIAYFLGLPKNKKEAQRIAGLPPLSQVREIGKLEAKLMSEVEKPKAPSKAPAPITPLTGTSPVKSDGLDDSLDDATWMKRRSKQVASRRR